jgi:hypothetical protein
MNNLAELTVVPLNTKEITNEWDSFIVSKMHSWDTRNYVSIDFFSAYFQNMLNNILNAINIPYKNIVIQCHDKALKDGKWYLTTTHRDEDRMSCITIPIKYNLQEPINFYTDDILVPNRGKSNPQKPCQTSKYSINHPTLVNVNNLHNVRVIADSFPRILLQISYDTPFPTIIEKNPSIWKIL